LQARLTSVQEASYVQVRVHVCGFIRQQLKYIVAIPNLISSCLIRFRFVPVRADHTAR
jgi:hypothetical protein